MTEIAGVDFSLARPAPVALTGAGFQFVMGYVSDYPAKNLTATNVAAYLAAGLSVGLVWETTAARALDGAAAGRADGAAADRQADAIGYPADCVIFFAVDEAVTLAQINGPIRAYAVAFDAAIKRPTGVYGSFLVVDTLVSPGVRPVRYGWQTAAWSRDSHGNAQLSAKAHLYQRAAPSGHWPVISGTDENVLCNPLPLAGPLHPAPPAPTPLPPPPPAPVPPVSPTQLPFLEELMALPAADRAALIDDIAQAVRSDQFTITTGPNKGTKIADQTALRDLYQNVQALQADVAAIKRKLGA